MRRDNNMNQEQLKFREYYNKYVKFYSKISKKELVDIVAYQNAMVVMRGDME